MDDPIYREYREKIEAVFARAAPAPGTAKTSLSPSGRYRLDTVELITGPKSWRYSRGIVTRIADGVQIADVHRNHSLFWHAWIEHPNGCEYLLCGEHYEGQTVVNLTRGEVRNWPGDGFCWVAAYPSPDGARLAVDGCIWADDGEIVVYDFRDPDALPYRELGRYPTCSTWKGWIDDRTIEYEELQGEIGRFGVP
jgi:hypothetical protein